MMNLEKQVEVLMRLCTAESEADRVRLRQEVRGQLGRRQAGGTDPEGEVREILLELGAPDHLSGHPYVVRAILLAAEERSYVNNITYVLYPRLAADFGTRPARVERAIRHLIEVTWTRGDMEVLTRYFGNTVSAEKGKPTNGEFIARLANVLRERTRTLSQ